LLIGAFILAERQFDQRRLLDTFLRVVSITAGVLVLGTVFWPWAMASPFIRPIEALFSFANAPYGADVLFNGRPVPSNDLPWYYVPIWLLISTPPVVIVGLVLAALFTKREWLPGLWALAVVALPSPCDRSRLDVMRRRQTFALRLSGTRRSGCGGMDRRAAICWWTDDCPARHWNGQRVDLRRAGASKRSAY
jgi:hypothetical protein